MPAYGYLRPCGHWRPSPMPAYEVFPPSRSLGTDANNRFKFDPDFSAFLITSPVDIAPEVRFHSQAFQLRSLASMDPLKGRVRGR